MHDKDRSLVRTSPAVMHLAVSKIAEVMEHISDRVRVEHKLSDTELLITLHVPTEKMARDRLDKVVALLSDSVL
jgi:hypothetical protein